jgi:3-hydroxyisobutyrate dehydrogenase-like beta-hydroxyacid dehydrogenase
VPVETLAVVSTGSMGSALARVWLDGGVRVVATAQGRTARTERLAEQAGVELLPTLAAAVAAADAVVSVVPSSEAGLVAREVEAASRVAGTTPLFADLNAIAPRTVRDLPLTRLDLVDGSISGPPPTRPGTTTVYLSGRRAHELADAPAPGLRVVVVGEEIGLASAVKMSTASVYKGTVALLAHALLAARANGVLEHVLDELGPAYVDRIETALARAGSKAPRYVGEMREIAATQAEAGLTPALFQAMAEVYTELARSPLADRAPEELGADDLETVLAALSAAGAAPAGAAATRPGTSPDPDDARRPRARLFGRGRGG